LNLKSKRRRMQMECKDINISLEWTYEKMTEFLAPNSLFFLMLLKSHLTLTIARPLLHCYSYTRGTQKAAKISNKNSFFNWVHSLHTELMNTSHSTNLFTNSCDHISTNGKAPLHSHINHNNPQFLYSLWRRANARNVSFLNLSRW